MTDQRTRTQLVPARLYVLSVTKASTQLVPARLHVLSVPKASTDLVVACRKRNARTALREGMRRPKAANGVPSVLQGRSVLLKGCVRQVSVRRVFSRLRRDLQSASHVHQGSIKVQ